MMSAKILAKLWHWFDAQSREDRLVLLGCILSAIGTTFYAGTQFQRSNGGYSPVKVADLLQTLGDDSQPDALRTAALTRLISEYGWTDLRNRNLSSLTLPSIHWDGVELTDAKLIDANVNGLILNDVLLVRADLTEAEAVKTNFNTSTLNAIILRDADCREAQFVARDLRAGNLTSANCTHANFSHATLHGVNCRNAIFHDAICRGTNFNSKDESDGAPDIYPTDISQAVFTSAELQGADLRNTKGIDTATFHGAEYNDDTMWPDGFDPTKAGAIKAE